MALYVQAVLLISVIYNLICPISGIFEFISQPQNIPEKISKILEGISEEKLKTYVQLGSDAYDRQLQLEKNLASSQITVKNGSISHVTLLERLPNKKAQHDNEVASKILKSSLYVLNSECLNIEAGDCAKFLAATPLPSSELRDECLKIIKSERDGHYPFRRLLPNNYMDKFYEMYSRRELPSPRLISLEVRRAGKNNNAEFDSARNLVFLQWSQFIEHDLSKSVATTMRNGNPIECCNADNLKLNPRNVHPACAPLIGTKSFNKYGPETCLNYVRSALAVGSNCNFNAAEQLNQATSYFDLSQLYGFTKAVQREMRTFNKGQLKSTRGDKLIDDLLPMANDLRAFCAVKMNSNGTCFKAGDSRVNANPFSIIIYTIFLRSHNQIANKLEQINPYLDDEQLFKIAKTINIAIYQKIIFKEWLPVALGKSIADTINSEQPAVKKEINVKVEQKYVSNEFATAAMRFYLSMMPNALHRLSSLAEQNEVNGDGENFPYVNIFILKDEIYRPTKLLSNSNKINRILRSMLNQKAMKMDAYYVESLSEEHLKNMKPTRSDVLAFDIQRGRDHGLQGYIKYLQICTKDVIKEWADLERYTHLEDVNILKSLYSNLNDIDLIVGGIFEIPVNGSTMGPTFTCILAEQFSKIRQFGHNVDFTAPILTEVPETGFWDRDWTAAKLICANSGVHEAPRNAFEVPSAKNPMIPCSKLLNS